MPVFTKIRQKNFDALYAFFKKYENYFILPEALKKAEPCWFGFMLVVKDGAPFDRVELVSFLESKRISTRSPLAGNLLKHPAYTEIEYKVVGDLKNTDVIMNNAFWIGVHPNIDKKRLIYIKQIFEKFFNEKNK